MSESNTALIKKMWLGGLFLLICVVVAAILLVGRAGPDAPPASEPAVQEPAIETPADDRLVVVQAEALPAVDDPFDARWEQAPSIEVPLEPQRMTAPMLEQATIDAVRVQAMRSQSAIAWRLSWAASEPAQMVNTGRFPDAVALQFPLADGAPPIMGSQDRPVHILYWNALWQRDVDEGFVDVQDLYPHFWNDVYWFARGSFPYPVAESFGEQARQWLVAHAAGNSMAQLERTQPVQELFAEGFGTLTDYPELHTTARGQWRDGQWVVVIERSLVADDLLAQRLDSGEANQVALAVWDGSAGNVGGRKHWTLWVPIEVR